MPCVPGVGDIDGDVDLAVVAIPPTHVAPIIEQCGERGLGAAVVLTAGLKETGPDGVALEEELVRRAREAKVALLGPNCLGIINTDPAYSLNASFAPSMPAAGNVAFMSQSGALCTSILDYARAQHIGFSKFISFGNKADIDEIDLLAYVAADPQTQVILMYLEDLDDGLRFIHLARAVTGDVGVGKPILAIKTGRTAEGASAAASHTGSLAGTDEMYDAIMAQAGVLRVDTVQELFDLAMAFGSQPMPRSNRVAIVTNAGGPGIMATDACVRQGLHLAEFSDATRQAMASSLPPAASTHNPVDLIGDARHDRYRAGLEAALADEGADAAIVILTPQIMTDIEDIARVVVEAAEGTDKPIIASFMGGVEVAAGVEVLREDVAAICAEVGFPVVMKIASPDILHKTEVGGVIVDLPDLPATEAAFDGLMRDVVAQRPEADIRGVFIQEMARPGREVILGAVRDPKFGPLVMFGLGGIYTEAMGDVAFRLAPFRTLSARHMLEEIRGRRILEGLRGEPPADLTALQECLERLAQLVVEFPVIRELDMNPVMSYAEGAAVADARIVMAGPEEG